MSVSALTTALILVCLFLQLIVVTVGGKPRVVHESILCDPIQPNPSADWPNPTRPNTICKYDVVNETGST